MGHKIAITAGTLIISGLIAYCLCQAFGTAAMVACFLGTTAILGLSAVNINYLIRE